MKIRKVQLNNFRQFYGEHQIEFATGAEQNVTLVHAENGFGKTTILNAVLWAFFHQTTTKFERPNEIVNYGALEERKTIASVSVEFELKGNNYIVTRNYDEDGRGRDKTSLSAFRVEHGALQVLKAPQTFISSVVPEEMAKYFFFDGEAAEAFSSATNFKAVGQAIRNILGSSLADTAIQDLKELSKQIDREIGQVPGNDALSTIEEKLSETKEQLETAVDRKNEHEDAIMIFRAQRDEIFEQLRTLEGAKEIQARRDEKKTELQQVNNELKSVRTEIIKWVGQRAIQIVSRKLAKETFEYVDEASLKGRIPSPYNEEFITELLKSEICICERDLKPQSKEWQAVTNLLLNASNAEILGRVIRARSRVSQLRREADEAPRSLESLQKRVGNLVVKRAQLEQGIVELGKKILDLPLAEISERERNRRALDEKIQKVSQDIGQIKNLIYQLEVRKQQQEQELERLARTNNRAQKLLSKRQLLERSAMLLKGLLDQYEKRASAGIEKEVNDILEKVAHRDYLCRINPDFSIDLTFPDGRSVPKSGGEKQLLSLLFIASLVKFSASRINDENEILKPGTVAPLILDAPFGQLDPGYQENTASYVSQLAEQVVLLVSSSHGNPRVLDALKPYIGAEYILFSENKEPRGIKDDTRLVLHGKEYVTSRFSQPRTMSRIERVF
jgi:DNA sulfur modification protein DndD